MIKRVSLALAGLVLVLLAGGSGTARLGNSSASGTQAHPVTMRSTKTIAARPGFGGIAAGLQARRSALASGELSAPAFPPGNASTLVIGALRVSAGPAARGGRNTLAFILGCPQRGVPGAPAGLTVTATGSDQVSLSWIAPVTDGVSPLTGYTIDATATVDGEALAGGPSAAGISDPYPASTSYTIGGLLPGSTYYFTVTADNASGESCPSNRVHATTLATPAPAANGGAPPNGGTGPNGGAAPKGGAGPNGGATGPLLMSGVAAVIIAGVGAVLLVRRRRPRSRSGVQAVPHAGPLRVVSVHVTGTDATHTIRIEPHPGASSTTIEEPRS